MNVVLRLILLMATIAECALCTGFKAKLIRPMLEIFFVKPLHVCNMGRRSLRVTKSTRINDMKRPSCICILPKTTRVDRLAQYLCRATPRFVCVQVAGRLISNIDLVKPLTAA